MTSRVDNIPKADGYYRHDGVRITHDPYSKHMAEKYGAPGNTDNEGFDPYADSVGAGIYGGTVRRNENGAIVIGQQYQNHNSRPGPVYAAGGYTPVSKAIAQFRKQSGGGNPSTLANMLQSYPDLVNDVSTGGASPLHTCGMSRENQHATAFLITNGADIEGVDTYGYTPLHRMASNNLAVGAQALLDAGADPHSSHAAAGSPLEVAMQSRAADVIRVLKNFGAKRHENLVSSIRIVNSGGPRSDRSAFDVLEGRYLHVDGTTHVPDGFDLVCKQQGWDTQDMWRRLNGGEQLRWFKHESNDSYIYWNKSDGKWWIDGPDGGGVWKATGPSHAPPATGWELITGDNSKNVYPQPALAIYRDHAPDGEGDDAGAHNSSEL